MAQHRWITADFRSFPKCEVCGTDARDARHVHETCPGTPEEQSLRAKMKAAEAKAARPPRKAAREREKVLGEVADLLGLALDKLKKLQNLT